MVDVVSDARDRAAVSDADQVGPPRTPTEADIELLWAASRVSPDTTCVAAAAAKADLAYVLEVATRQRVAALILRSLVSAGVALDPSANGVIARTRLWEAHARLGLPSAAALAIGPLTDAGIKPMALKGLALVGRYPEAGLRPMDDIDLLVPAEVRSHAAKALQQAGWRRLRHLDPDPGYDLVFRHPLAAGVPLELHYELARWQERTNGVDARRLWAARVPVTVLECPAWGLAPELELIALIAHAAKRFHLFGRLLWLVDVAVVVATSSPDWDEVARLAHVTRMRVSVAAALRLARRLGAEVPDELLVLPPLLERSGALDTLMDPSRPFVARAAGQRWMAYALVDDAAGKLRLAMGDLVRPPRGEPRTRVVAGLAKAVQKGFPRLARARLRKD